jgi:hypothetical protein
MEAYTESKEEVNEGAIETFLKLQSDCYGRYSFPLPTTI